MKKRLLSLLLVLAMVGTMLPLSALAEEPDPATPAPEAETFAAETAEEAPDTPEPAAAEAPAPVEDVRLGDGPGVQKTYLVNAIQSGSCGKNVNYTLTDDGVLTISGTGGMDDYSESSASPWDSLCSSIQTVVVQDGVSSIGKYAFYYCTNLSSVSLPASLYYIRDYAFSYCKSLSSISLPSKLTLIASAAFLSCNNLSSITIPASVAIIGDAAFSGCKILTSITVNSSNSQYSSVNGVLYSKDKTALLACPGGKSGSFTVPAGVSIIGNQAFAYCQNITELLLSSTVNEIGSGAFLACTFSAITIPKSILTIGNKAFLDCNNLAEVYYGGTEPQWNDVGIGTNNASLKSAVIHFDCSCGENVYWSLNSGTLTVFGSGSMTDYTQLSDVPWRSLRSSIQRVVIKEGVTNIGTFSFSGCQNLSSVSIPANVKYIGPSAFFACEALTTVSLVEGLNSIYDSAFAACTSLSSVTIPASVTYIAPSNPFRECIALKEINVKNGNQKYASVDGVLYNKDKTELLGCPGGKVGLFTVPSSVTTIGSCAFQYCQKITAIAFSSKVEKIGDSAFYNCNGLSEVYYGGTKPQWNNIGIGTDNEILKSAVIHFDCSCGENVYWSMGYWSTGSGTLTVTVFGSGSMTDYTQLSDVPWRSLRSSIQRVVIKEGVTRIGGYAFFGCENITSVSLPESLTGIGEYAFDSCKKLVSFPFPSGLKSIDDYAFDSCSSLSSVTLPESLYDIGNYAFFNCDKLVSVSIPAGVSDIGTYAFGGCDALTAINVNSSNNFYSSADGVLYNKAKTALLAFPGGKAGTFAAPAGITTIGEAAFYACNKIVSVVLPSGISKIDYYAFSSCTGLSAIVIPDSLSYIRSYAFEGCTALKDVYYSSTEVNWNDMGRTSGNDPLYNATIHYNFNNTCGDGVYWILADGVLTIFGNGTMATYSTGSRAPWYSQRTGIQSVSIQHGVKNIGSYAFYQCSSVISVSIPSSVRSIAAYALCSCTKLASVSIPSGVTSIGDYAFYSCSGLSTVTVPSFVSSIGNYAFAQCAKLESVSLPTGLTDIGNYAFYNCSKLTSVSIPENVTSIGTLAFGSCSELTAIKVNSSNSTYSATNGILYDKAKKELICCPGGISGAVTVPSGVTAIRDSAFYNCKKVTSVILPSGVASIGASAFYTCTLTSIAIPKSTTTIAASAFQNCSKLTDVYYGGSETDWSSISIGSSNTPLKNATIHYSNTCGTNVYWMLADGVLTIYGSGAMKDYSSTDPAPWASQTESIQSVVIKSGVSGIGEDAFSGCSKLTSVSLPSGLQSIGLSAFSSCSSLTAITIPSSVTTISGNPLSSCSSLTAINVNSSNPNYSSVDGVLYNKDKTTLIACPGGKSGAFIVPSGVTAIGGSAFYGCKKLTSVLLPAGVTSISNMAFSQCAKLTTIEFPKSLTTVWKWAFNGCSKLKDIYYPGTSADWEAIDFKASNNLPTSADRHYCPVGDINNDGKRTLKDVSLLFQWWNGKSISSGYLSRTALCNANGDDGTDLRDAALIYRLVSENR